MKEMDEKIAKKIIDDMVYLANFERGDTDIYMDGCFSASELAAVSWAMENAPELLES